MTRPIFTNNAKTTLSAGINNSVTSIAVTSGAAFPSPTGSQWAYLTIEEGSTIEIVKLTARSGNTLTVTRAQDGTSAASFTTAATVSLRAVKGIFDDIFTALGLLVAKAGDTMTGPLVNSQALATTDGTKVRTQTITATGQSNGTEIYGEWRRFGGSNNSHSTAYYEIYKIIDAATRKGFLRFTDEGLALGRNDSERLIIDANGYVIVPSTDGNLYLGITSNGSGREGIGLYHTGNAGFLDCIQDGVSWHSFTVNAGNITLHPQGNSITLAGKTLVSAGSARFQGADAHPAGSSGVGIEFYVSGSTGIIQGFDRTAGAFANLAVAAPAFSFNAQVKIGVGYTIEFTAAGGSGVLNENYGIRYVGDATHPFQCGSSSLLVGLSAAGSNFGSGNIYCTGTLSQSYSDDRLKTRTGRIENALEKLLSIEGFLYEENDLARSFGYDTRGQQVGVSAQAVLRVQPEAVKLAAFDYSTDADGNPVSKSGQNYLTVDYPRLQPLHIEATRELTARVVYLEQQIEALLRQQKGGENA